MGKFKRSSRKIKTKIRLPKTTKKTDAMQNKAITNLSNRIKKIDKSIELKMLQSYQSSYNNPNTLLTTTWTYLNPVQYLLNPSILGTTNVTRLGDKIRMTSLHVSGQIYQTDGGTVLGINIPIRIIVFIHKKPRGTSAILTQSGTTAGNTALFYNVGGGAPTTYQQYDTGVNINMYDSYKILFDKVYKLKTEVGAYVPSTDNDISVNPYINFNIRKKLNYITDYSRSNSGSVLDIEANALYIAFITDTNSGLSLEMDSRVYFKDI